MLKNYFLIAFRNLLRYKSYAAVNIAGLAVGIAFLIAAPVAWYFMNGWLQGFSFRISLGAGLFMPAVALSIAIAWLTVSHKAIRAAIANPVKSLRTE